MGSKIIQVTNIAPAATRDQMSTLFGFLGKIEEIHLFPNEEGMISYGSKVCFIRFADASSVGVAQHLTNTVFIDRALIAVPYADVVIPDEDKALALAACAAVTGIVSSPTPPSMPANLINQIQTVGSSQVIATIDPRFTALGLPQYPTLPANTDPSRIEEIRRTVYVGNLDSSVTSEQLLSFFNQVGEVKYIRMAGDETQPTRFAFVEFTDQSSVAAALQYHGAVLGGRPLKVNHSNNAIVKPQAKSNEAAQREIEEAMKRVREAQSLITAAIEPPVTTAVAELVVEKVKEEKSRSRSGSRSKRSVTPVRHRSRSVSRRRSHSRSKSSRSHARSRSRSKRRSRTPKKRSRSRDRRSPSRSSKRTDHRSKSPRRRSPSRSKDKSSGSSRHRSSRRSKSISPRRRSKSRSPRSSTKSSRHRGGDSSSSKDVKESARDKEKKTSLEVAAAVAAAASAAVAAAEQLAAASAVTIKTEPLDDDQRDMISVDKIKKEAVDDVPTKSSSSSRHRSDHDSHEKSRGSKSSPSKSSSSRKKTPDRRRRSHSRSPVHSSSSSRRESRRSPVVSSSSSRARRSSRSPVPSSSGSKRGASSRSRKSRSGSRRRSRTPVTPPRRTSRSPRRRTSRTPTKRRAVSRSRSRSKSPRHGSSKHKKSKKREPSRERDRRDGKDRDRDRDRSDKERGSSSKHRHEPEEADVKSSKVTRDYDEEEKGYDSDEAAEAMRAVLDRETEEASPKSDSPPAKTATRDDSNLQSVDMEVESD